MNKRVISIAIVLFFICVLVTHSIAEGKVFVFRNGVHFGDTAEQVLEKEGSQCKNYNKTTLIVDNAQLSGIRNSILYYSFTYDRLSSILLLYNDKNDFSDDDLDERLKEYKLINEGLIRKYGSTYKDELSNIVSLPGGRINYYQENKDYDIISTSQWILNYDNNDLIIEHVLASRKSRKEGNVYIHCISYQWTKPNMVLTDIVDSDL